MDAGPYNAFVQTNKPSADAVEREAAGAPPRPGRILVETEALFLFGLVGFVGIAMAAQGVLGLERPFALGPLASIAFAGAPALLWLGYFYRQDRHEPEPKRYVFGVFLLGAFVAAPIAGFVLDHALARSTLSPFQLDPLAAENLVRMVLIIAVTQELAKYCVVRYTVYPSREFDEPLDGIVYASAVGIGFATYENIEFLRGGGGDILLAAGAGAIVINTLAHACFAGVVGYALARAKFVCRSHIARTVTLVVGLVVAVLLNGAFQIIARAARSRGFVSEPWREVAVTVGFVIVVFFAISLVSRRLLLASKQAPEEA